MPQAGSPELHRAIEGLQRLSELFQERRAQLARAAGLSEQQWRMLEEIAQEGFLPSLFARRRECTPAAVSKVLRRLLELGLVSVSVSQADARQRRYVLTAKGSRALERLAEQRQDAIHRVWRDLGRQELARFARFSHKLGDRLEAYARGVERPARVPARRR